MSDFKERRSVTLECPKHGPYTGESIKFKFFDKDTHTMCPQCEQEMKRNLHRQEAETKYYLEISRWKAMNIEKRFWAADFEHFNAYNTELRGHLETCRRFAKNPDGKLVMLGENGNGKTHLAVSILKAVGGVLYTAYEIGIKLRQSYEGELKEWEVFNELCTVPLLVIDEVEKIKDSESKQHWFSHIIGKRYNRMLPVIFIANCHTKKHCPEQKKPCPRCLEYHLDDAIISRIIEDGIIMKFGSEDYRKKIRNAKMRQPGGII